MYSRRLSEIQDLAATSKDAGGVFGRRLLCNHQLIGPPRHLVEVVVDQSGNVRNRRQNETAVRAIDCVQIDVRIKHPDVPAFANKLFKKRDNWAFAKVVCVLLEREAED